MLKLLIAFLITFGFVANEAEYNELPQEVKIELLEIYQNFIGSEDRILQ